MMRSLLLLAFFSRVPLLAQYYEQYFDGANTDPANSVLYALPNDTVSPWMVGEPHKAVFSSAYTPPKALLTDTLASYAPDDTSTCIL